jgi:hypothetical protein
MVESVISNEVSSTFTSSMHHCKVLKLLLDLGGCAIVGLILGPENQKENPKSPKP